jgi:prepilin-type N-terminal cleavage/methylation domain-containing protein
LIHRLLNEQRGYSLVEVMVAIILLAIAIIPMVGMFDMGLDTANTGTKYDRARTLANTKLEQAKTLDYETVRTNFPSQAATNKGAPGATGSVTSSSVTIAQDPRVPPGFSYVITKQYLQQPPTGLAGDPGEEVEFNTSASVNDTALLRVTVTVSWSGNSYRTTGVVAG